MPTAPFKLVRLWRAALVVCATVLVWVAHFDRWSPASWRVPTDYTGDAHESLARIKAASEGEMLPLAPQVITRLGAPFGAHWNAYPTPDKPLMLLLGQFVRFVGVNATANLGLLLAQVTAALAFYFVARWLRCRWPWAAAGALLFAYTYHTFHRGLAHFSLIFTWTVPLGLLTVWLIAGSRRLAWGRREALVCLGSALALGISNPYNLFFWLQLMAWALLAQVCGARRRANLEIGCVAMAVALVGFFVVNAEVWLHVEDPQAQPLLARNYGGTERYALKPVEMFIPPSFHHADALAFFGRRYERWSEWRGEVFLPYLGLIGIAAFVALAVATTRAILRRRPLPGQALSIGWLLAYSAIGGITNILAFFIGLQMFRATNRAAIFISGTILVFAVVRISRWTARWPAWLTALAACAVTALGLWDQLPRPESREDQQAIARAVQADEEFGRELDAALPADAMVFQLPVLGFPEVVPPYQLDSYEHFRPYLTTNHVRFTYGSPKLRSRIRWERELEALPPAEMVKCLEEYGFGALYLNRKGFADRGDSLLRKLAALGYTRRIDSAQDHQVAILLHPSSPRLLPLAHSFAVGNGWQTTVSQGTRWAYDDAALSYYNPYAQKIRADLSFTLVAPTDREVALLHDGDVVEQFNVTRRPAHFAVAGVELAPGVNHFVLRTNAPAVRSARSHQLRAFGLQASTVQLAPVLDPLAGSCALLAGSN